MRLANTGAALLLLGVLAGGPAPAAAQKKDYLTSVEADKIRDAGIANPRIKLFLEFATDRLQKFQYELARGSKDRLRAERLNSLLNAYTGCLDDAAELIDLAREKQEDVREAIKEMKKKGKEFLAALEQLAASGAERESYQETLDDAIIATKEALKEADQAEQELAPPPVRRRPS